MNKVFLIFRTSSRPTFSFHACHEVKFVNMDDTSNALSTLGYQLKSLIVSLFRIKHESTDGMNKEES